MKIVGLVLLLVTPTYGATFGCPSGALTATAQTATGPSSDGVNVGSRTQGLVFQATTTGTSATVVIELSCDGTNWAQVQNSSMSLASGALSQAVSVLYPTCTYRANVTACSACSVTVKYACAGW